MDIPGYHMMGYLLWGIDYLLLRGNLISIDHVMMISDTASTVRCGADFDYDSDSEGPLVKECDLGGYEADEFGWQSRDGYGSYGDCEISYNVYATPTGSPTNARFCSFSFPLSSGN